MDNTRALLHAVSGIVLGTVWFTLLVTLWSLGLGMLVTLLGLPIIWLILVITPYLAAVESELARSLLDARAYPPPIIRGWELRSRLALKANWHAQGYLLLRFFPGLVVQCVLVALLIHGAGLMIGPAWYWAPKDGIELGILEIHTLPVALAFIPVGAAMIALAWWLAGPYGRWQRHLAEQLLHGQAGDLAPRRLGPRLHQTLLCCAAAQAICLIVWAATDTASVWPAYTGIGLAIPVAMQLAHRPSAGPVRQHAALGVICVVACLGIWVASGAGYFWPMWVALGWAVSLVLPALWHSGVKSVAPRVEQLTRTRAEVVGVQEGELRRIERDLHDGAQARLVSVAMSLGLAEERFEDDPDQARELMGKAKAQARLAIRELRDLARTIAPPILTSHGLAAAIDSLAITSPLPVIITGDEGRPRPSAGVERAAYFVAAESLANAAKHAGAQRIDIRIGRTEDRLEIEIADDGRGGANPDGPGLAGLRSRVEAVDGRLTVTTSAGSGTNIRASFPCAPS